MRKTAVSPEWVTKKLQEALPKASPERLAKFEGRLNQIKAREPGIDPTPSEMEMFDRYMQGGRGSHRINISNAQQIAKEMFDGYMQSGGEYRSPKAARQLAQDAASMALESEKFRRDLALKNQATSGWVPPPDFWDRMTPLQRRLAGAAGLTAVLAPLAVAAYKYQKIKKPNKKESRMDKRASIGGHLVREVVIPTAIGAGTGALWNKYIQGEDPVQGALMGAGLASMIQSYNLFRDLRKINKSLNKPLDNVKPKRWPPPDDVGFWHDAGPANMEPAQKTLGPAMDFLKRASMRNLGKRASALVPAMGFPKRANLLDLISWAARKAVVPGAVGAGLGALSSNEERGVGEAALKGALLANLMRHSPGGILGAATGAFMADPDRRLEGALGGAALAGAMFGARRGINHLISRRPLTPVKTMITNSSGMPEMLLDYHPHRLIPRPGLIGTGIAGTIGGHVAGRDPIRHEKEFRAATLHMPESSDRPMTAIWENTDGSFTLYRNERETVISREDAIMAFPELVKE